MTSGDGSCEGAFLGMIVGSVLGALIGYLVTWAVVGESVTLIGNSVGFYGFLDTGAIQRFFGACAGFLIGLMIGPITGAVVGARRKRIATNEHGTSDT